MEKFRSFKNILITCLLPSQMKKPLSDSWISFRFKMRKYLFARLSRKLKISREEMNLVNWYRLIIPNYTNQCYSFTKSKIPHSNWISSKHSNLPKMSAGETRVSTEANVMTLGANNGCPITTAFSILFMK